MKATKQTYTGRKKTSSRGLPAKAAAERRDMRECPCLLGIAEHNDIITDLPADSLLKRILSRDN